MKLDLENAKRALLKQQKVFQEETKRKNREFGREKLIQSQNTLQGLKKRKKKGKKQPPKTSESIEADLDSVEADADLDSAEADLDSVEESLESCKIIRHCRDSTVMARWENRSQTRLKLYDMWVDYPNEVRRYRGRVFPKKPPKAWRDPNEDDIEEVVRILGMNEERPELRKATFTTVWNNGYQMDNHPFELLLKDAQELLEEFLGVAPRYLDKYLK